MIILKYNLVIDILCIIILKNWIFIKQIYIQ